jgi:hypothetical protein
LKVVHTVYNSGASSSGYPVVVCFSDPAESCYIALQEVMLRKI